MSPSSRQASCSGTQHPGVLACAALITSAPPPPPPSILSSSDAPTRPHSSRHFCPGHPSRAMQQQQQSATHAVLTPPIKNTVLAPVTDSGVHHKLQSVPSDCVLLAAYQVCCPLLPSGETDKLVLSPCSHNWILSNDAFYTVID